MVSYKVGICACGCGGLTNKSEKSYKSQGILKGDYRKLILGHQSRLHWECQVSGCGREHHSKGFCRIHYERSNHNSLDLMNPDLIVGQNKKERNGMWKGNKVSASSGRARARRWFKLGRCELCNNPAVDRHHKDGNTSNNDPSNIQRLCRACHARVDGRREGAIAILKQRSKKGELNPKAKLTCIQVMEILGRYSKGDISRKELGKEFGVSADHIGNIVTGKSWNELSFSGCGRGE